MQKQLQLLQSLYFSISTPLPPSLNSLNHIFFGGHLLICHLFIQKEETEGCSNPAMKNVGKLVTVVSHRMMWKMGYSLVLTSGEG